MLGEKVFGRDIKIENCSFRRIRFIKKSNFWKFSFFQILQNFERTITVLGGKLFGRDIKNENCSLRLRRTIKKPNFWKISFFQILQKFERTITVLGGKFFGRDIKNENCSLRLKRSIKKPNFWKISFFFKFFRTLNEHLPCLAKNFSAGISKLKIAVFVPKDQSKNQTSESSLFFQILQNFERTFTVLGEKLFGGVIKIENCSLRLIRSNKKWNFWKISFFSDSSEIRTNNYRARRKFFRQGYQKWKLQSSSQKINQKTNLLENLFFLQILQNFERTFTVLGEKLFGRVFKIENCSLRPKRSIEKPNFWKFSFFSNSSELWTNIHRAWRKTFRRGYQNWKLQSSSHKIKQKMKLLKNLFFFKIFRILNEHLLCLVRKFLAGLSKLKNAVFVSLDQPKNQTTESSVYLSNSSEIWTSIYRAWPKSFGQGYQNWKLQSSSQKINQKTTLLENLFFSSNPSEFWTNLYRAWRKTFRQGFQKWKLQSSSQKINQKTKLLKVLFFFQNLQNFERTLPCLAKKFWAGISKLKIVLFVSRVSIWG